jgi:preprotein translocase subunit SecE
VARDRQRAKQRKARRGQNPGPAPSQPRRENVPGELDHASGEVDEFDAALIDGADGDAAADAHADAETVAPADSEGHPEQLSDEAFEDLEDEVDEAALEPAPDELELEHDDEPELEGDERETAAVVARPPARADRASVEPTRRGAGRFMAFLRASWAELQRVQWPDRRQVAQATAVVLGFVVVAGAYLGLADRVASELVDLII